MKIVVKGSIFLKESNIYILTIKFIEGKKILPGNKLINEGDLNLKFEVQSLTLDSNNYTEDSFDIVIEKPTIDLKSFEGKTFKLI